MKKIKQRYSARFATAKEAQAFKRKFRASPEWKFLRLQVAQLQENKDFITGKKLSPHYHLHHMNLKADDYDDLTVWNYVALNHNSHKLVHMLWDMGIRKTDNVNINNILKTMEKLNNDT